MSRVAAERLDGARACLTAAGWAASGEHRGGGYWFVCGKRGERMNITLEWADRWDVTITIGAHELVHQWADADPGALIESATAVARDILRAQVEALQ